VRDPAIPRLVLASASPRRTALLAQLGLPHEVRPAHILEEAWPGETPVEHVERLAAAKASAVAASHPDALVLGGDTVVLLDDALLGKPTDTEGAVRMLLSLSGREHTVVSALALAGPAGAGPSVVTRTAQVEMRAFDEWAARAYVATGEPMDKAGAYGIQGAGAALVSRVEGDYYTVVGLPVSGLIDLLREAGWPYGFGGLGTGR